MVVVGLENNNVQLAHSPMQTRNAKELAGVAILSAEAQGRARRYRSSAGGVSQGPSGPAAIFYEHYLNPSPTRLGRILAWMGDPLNSPKWEWIFQAPALGLVLAGFGLPYVAAVAIFSAMLFAAVHPKQFAPTFADRISLFMLGLGLSAVIVAPLLLLAHPTSSSRVFEVHSVVQGAVSLGLFANLLGHSLFNFHRHGRRSIAVLAAA